LPQGGSTIEAREGEIIYVISQRICFKGKGLGMDLSGHSHPFENNLDLTPPPGQVNANYLIEIIDPPEIDQSAG